LTKKKKIDVLLHKFVPQHLLLTKEDPVAIAIGAKEGDIIRIVRDSHTTVKNIDYFRYVKKEKG